MVSWFAFWGQWFAIAMWNYQGLWKADQILRKTDNKKSLKLENHGKQQGNKQRKKKTPKARGRPWNPLDIRGCPQLVCTESPFFPGRFGFGLVPAMLAIWYSLWISPTKSWCKNWCYLVMSQVLWLKIAKSQGISLLLLSHVLTCPCCLSPKVIEDSNEHGPK